MSAEPFQIVDILQHDMLSEHTSVLIEVIEQPESISEATLPVQILYLTNVMIPRRLVGDFIAKVHETEGH